MNPEPGTRAQRATITLGEIRTPDGSLFSLHRHEDSYSLKLDGTQLMNSSWTLSERLLADAACDWTHQPAAPSVLIGGLGLGFSLKRVLELVGEEAQVHQAELLAQVVTWNREFLMGVNGALLDDPRVTVHIIDVCEHIAQSAPAQYDAILLDVDNGPTDLVQPENFRLYDAEGLRLLHKILRPGGRVAFWTADPEPRFEEQLREANFTTSEISAKSHEAAKHSDHRIYVGQR